MLVDPSLAYRVQTVRAAGDRIRNAGVTGGAFDHDSRMALQLNIPEIVVGVGRRELRVSRTVASLTLQTTVAGREAVKR